MPKGHSITTPRPLSKAYEKFLGKGAATRSEVYSAICAHIRLHDLRDEATGRIEYDKTLAKLLGHESALYTDIMKHIQESGAFV